MTSTTADKGLQLGRKVELPASPDKAVLDFVNNPALYPYIVQLHCPEFTSLCPVTGAPDFASIEIEYVPNNFLVESKSLKLFLGSFRNHGAFHEAVINEIADRLFNEGEFMYISVVGNFASRGGIAIIPKVVRGQMPSGIS